MVEIAGGGHRELGRRWRRAGATSLPTLSGTARPENPESFSFSTPTAMAMSYIPAATA